MGRKTSTEPNAGSPITLLPKAVSANENAATLDPDKGSSGVVEQEPGTRPLTAASEAEGDWLCGWCHTCVADDQDRFSIDGKSEFTFSNPEGARFEIITFSETRRCDQSGAPTLEHTWFPGCAWSWCHCSECGQQLGWFYTGAEEFVGLIKARIVRGLWVRN